MTSTDVPQMDSAPAAGGSTLPQTGIQQQVNTINQQQASQMGSFGQGALQQIGAQGQAAQSQISSSMLGQQQSFGSTNLNALAKSLFQSYGLGVGRGSMVDAQGNLTASPDEIAKAQGLRTSDVAQKMSYVAQSLSDYQNKQAQQQGIGALQAGLGQVRSRGRGSLAAMQSGYYQQLAQAYTDPNMLSQAQDFSYYVQRDFIDREHALREKELKKQKKKGLLGGVLGAVGAVIGGIYGGPAGAGIGGSVGTSLGEGLGG